MRTLYEQEDYEQLLSEYMPTSHHLMEYARATEEEIAEARALPLGTRAAKLGTPSGTFALLRYGSEVHCVFAPDINSEAELQLSPDDAAHEAVLAHIAAERETVIRPIPDNTDARLEDLCRRWARRRGVDVEEITVVVAARVEGPPQR